MKTQKIAVFAIIALLSACGGGGGSSGSPAAMAAPQSAPAQPASQSGAQSAPVPQSVPAPKEPFNVPPTTLSATIDGMNFTVTYSATPNNGTTAFNGQTASSSTVSVTVQQDGTVLSSETSTEYYLPDPFTLLGISGTAANTSYTLAVNSVNPLPAMLTVGTSGTLFSGSYMASGTSIDIGMLTQTYSVAAGPANTVTLTIESDGTINGQTVTNGTVFTVDSKGKLSLQSVEVMVKGQAFTFTVPM